MSEIRKLVLAYAGLLVLLALTVMALMRTLG